MSSLILIIIWLRRTWLPAVDCLWIARCFCVCIYFVLIALKCDSYKQQKAFFFLYNIHSKNARERTLNILVVVQTRQTSYERFFLQCPKMESSKTDITSSSTQEARTNFQLYHQVFNSLFVRFESRAIFSVLANVGIKMLGRQRKCNIDVIQLCLVSCFVISRPCVISLVVCESMLKS